MTKKMLQTTLLVYVLLTVSWASDDSLENTGWIRFTVKEICNDWAKLQWEPVLEKFSISQRPPRFTSCEISYMNLHTQEARLVMVVPDSKVNWLKLGKLEESTHYMASMTCNNTFTSATIHFVTGFPCRGEVETEASLNTTEVSRKPVQLSKASGGISVTDTVLGLLFGLCGATIVTCAAYYYWKKRRHRQRILLIFRQSQSDPFLALHGPADQMTIIGL
ncbi:uncharacterized protein LOC112573224 isoform X2 [Pomacea canaliculata]|uniref:uncharacterized protein LOC112573224 isoform X2 n=1 Tax=Pomacea canaliculata TaxID=400727 RepID=UPI000D73C09C|nr:uncharacterized protein LOC112573224 isoform X2 [Pomacea canaliculata]